MWSSIKVAKEGSGENGVPDVCAAEGWAADAVLGLLAFGANQHEALSDVKKEH